MRGVQKGTKMLYNSGTTNKDIRDIVQASKLYPSLEDHLDSLNVQFQVFFFVSPGLSREHLALVMIMKSDPSTSCT